MTRIERFVAAGVFLMAFVCALLAGIGPALAIPGQCFAQWTCTAWVNPDDHDEGKICHVLVTCSTFVSGDCDQACDTQFDDGYNQCLAESGSLQSCIAGAARVFTACVMACIPMF